MCKKPGWHRIEECENTDDIETRRFNRLKSDLFHTRKCEIPAQQRKKYVRLPAQTKDKSCPHPQPLPISIPSLTSLLTTNSMHHNAHLPFFTALPPEIRLRIYTHILGFQTLWIGHTPEDRKWNYVGKTLARPYFSTIKEKFHRGEAFNYVLKDNGAGSADPPARADLRVLRICRQIYTEAALLPYRLTRFVFQDDAVRRRFEKGARPGKKRAQKQAVGKYDIMPLIELEAELQNT